MTAPITLVPGGIDGSDAAAGSIRVPDGVQVVDAERALALTEGAAVVVLAEWTLALGAELSRHALKHPVVLLPVRFDGALTVVGPVLRPGAAACLACTEYQRLATAGGRVPYRSPGLVMAGLPAPALAEAIGALAADLLLEEPEPAAGATVQVVHNGRATWSTHQVRPVGGCAVCRPLPPDTEQDAVIPEVPRPLPDPAVLRGANPRTGNASLRAALYDERFGPVRRLIRSEHSVFGLSSAFVTDGRLLDDGGYGRSTDFESGERVALFESVERLAGMRPTGHRTVLRASFAALGAERALDPERLGLPEPAHHGHPASRTVPYTPRLELDWVQGWSLTRRRPVAVPEHVAYWDVPGPDRPRVVYESSNGCGLGNSRQEAVLYGLFEVAERDAFLMAWYAATPLRRIAVPADDPEVAALADRAALAGYRLTLLDATNDFGVPAVVALCRYRGGHPAAPGRSSPRAPTTTRAPPSVPPSPRWSPTSTRPPRGRSIPSARTGPNACARWWTPPNSWSRSTTMSASAPSRRPSPGSTSSSPTPRRPTGARCGRAGRPRSRT